jgi:hypothetical protein
MILADSNKKIYESTKEIYFFFGKNFETKF